jgi:tetratricopeptide (TPR) repeat protein/O-antigen ligase
LAIAGLLLGCRYFRTTRDLTMLLGAMTFNGAALSFFGMLQRFSGTDKLFWTVELTQGGVPFGPFVNRNNAGGFLLICLACAIGLLHLLTTNRKNKGPLPIISKEIPIWRQFSQLILVFLSELTAAKMAVIIAVVFVATGILATLSRGAISAMLIGATVTLIFYGVARRPRNLSIILIPLTVAVLVLGGWLGFADQIMERFDKSTLVELTDPRFKNWSDTWPSVSEMGLLGSGLGSYSKVHRLYRTDVEHRYFEYAENQYFQALVESGWLGLTVYVLAWLMAFYYAFFLLFRSQSPATLSTGLAGMFLLSSQAFASFFDFGFYIPANMLAMSVAVGVLAYYAHSMANRLKKKTPLRFLAPNILAQAVLILVFSAGTMSSLDFYRESKIEKLVKQRNTDFRSHDLDLTNSEIAALVRHLNRASSTPALNRVGDLYVHRARLELFNSLVDDEALQQMDAEMADHAKQVLWEQTALPGLFEYRQSLADKSGLSLAQFRSNAFMKDDLPVARRFYAESCRLSPLQPRIHMRIGFIDTILNGIDSGRESLENASELAPTNPFIRRTIGEFYLIADDPASAAPHLKAYLELEPKEFEPVLNMLTGRTSRRVKPVDHELILEACLPTDAKMLYEFATKYAEPRTMVRQIALERAEDLLADQSVSQTGAIALSAEIKVALGEYDVAIENFNAVLKRNPADHATRYRLVRVLSDQGLLDEALDAATQLVRLNDKKPEYKQILNELKRAFDERERDKNSKNEWP